MKIPAILYSRPVANVSAQGCLVLLAWLDATGNQDVVITAISDGRRISPESAFAQLFANGRAGATVALPWIERASRPNVPICAYAAIVATAKRPLEATHLDRGQMWSGFVRDPDANDVARLNEEYRTTVRHLVGVSADMIDSHGPTYGRPGRIEINIFEGTALRDGREIALSDGEFAVAAMVALNRQDFSRQAWCEKLWPDRDSESAGRLLKVYIHRIRAKFGTRTVIETHDNGYRLGPDVVVDVHVLEALTRRQRVGALTLDASQLRMVQRAFDGFKKCRHLRLSWIAQFDELERRLLATGVELARILVEDAFFRKNDDHALMIAEYLQTVDPYDDVAAELLIRAQLRLGRPDAAQRHFNAFCRTLRDELDLPPPRHLSLLLAQQ
jgi:DNA-binding SARP family transcriptional activator